MRVALRRSCGLVSAARQGGFPFFPRPRFLWSPSKCGAGGRALNCKYSYYMWQTDPPRGRARAARRAPRRGGHTQLYA